MSKGSRKNLCLGKSVKNPNSCKKVRGCKVASGEKRTYCRKIHNKTKSVRKTMKNPIEVKNVPRLRRSKRIKEHNDGTTANRKKNFMGNNSRIIWRPHKNMFSDNQNLYMKNK